MKLPNSIMHNSKKGTIEVITIFIVLAVYTSSFDIFMTFNIIGFNFRISQILMLFPMMIAFLQIVYNKHVVTPIGYKWLILWTLIIIAYIPNTNLLSRSVGYAFWLLFNITIVLTFVQFFNTASRAVFLFRQYVFSFVGLAVIGIVQFVTPLMGIGSFYVTQWWVQNTLPRVNGFSYEPSYYATYLLMGWVICMYLEGTQSNIFSRAEIRIFITIITLAMILSSSRIGLLMMGVWYISYIARVLFSRSLCLIRIDVILLLAFVILLSLFIYRAVAKDFVFWLSGLGLYNSSSHSITERLYRANETLLSFIKSPIIGYSLGGVAPAIARLNGVSNVTLENIKNYEGMCVFLEVLAASGLVGIVPFLMFILSLIKNPIYLSKFLTREQSNVLIALVQALIFELITLQFNQNILRPYLWMHIAILVSYYSASKRELISAQLREGILF